MDGIDIKGIDKGDLLAALYNRARPQGMGFRQPGHDLQMTKGEADEYIEKYGTRFNYVKGRPIKVEFKDDVLLFARLYDRDTGGEGTCEQIVAILRGTVGRTT